MYICHFCNLEKSEKYFKRIGKHRNKCMTCHRATQHEWYVKNKIKIIERVKRNTDKQTKAQYDKVYRYKNADKILARQNVWKRKKKSTDVQFRIREEISKTIRRYIKSKKNKKSIKNYLNIYEIIQHLESLFEPWMNWSNWGIYNSRTWIDDDQATWTWQIDHIVPQSDLPYSSMDDDNFKKCWQLDNLRPLSAKQNIMDGCTRIRHRKGNKI